jgi:hypothetical protein
MPTTWRLYVIGGLGMVAALWLLHLWRETRDELAQEKQRHEAREKQLQELILLLQRDSAQRVVVQVEQAKATGNEVRSRPATVPEAQLSEARGVAWDKQLEDALARGRRAGHR